MTHTAPLFQSDDKPMDPAPALTSLGYMGTETAPDTTSDPHRVP